MMVIFDRIGRTLFEKSGKILCCYIITQTHPSISGQGDIDPTPSPPTHGSPGPGKTMTKRVQHVIYAPSLTHHHIVLVPY